jgi:hypothetical protein
MQAGDGVNSSNGAEEEKITAPAGLDFGPESMSTTVAVA